MIAEWCVQGNHTFLGNSSSSSFVQIGKQFQVTYGTGQVAGVTVSDNVNIAGLALDNHTFVVANTESTDFSADTVPFDGLIGLAQSVHIPDLLIPELLHVWMITFSGCLWTAFEEIVWEVYMAVT